MTATRVQDPPRPPGAWRLGRSRIGVELKQFFRDRDSAIWNFSLPVLLMVIFGSVFGSQGLGPGLDVTFAQYFVAGMIASGVVYTSFQNLAIAIPIEREEGTLKRLSGTPMPKVAYFVGKIATVFLVFVVQVIVLLIVGMIFFKLRLPSSGTQWLTFAWVSILGLVSCTLCGLAFSSVPRSARGASAIVAPIVLVLQFTSGVFFQFSQLPTWMQHFASIFPLKWLTQGMRSVFLPSQAQQLEVTGSWELERVAIVLVGWCVLALVLALVFFRWQLRKDD